MEASDPEIYEPGVDPGLGFNLISWANFPDGVSRWENAVEELHQHGFGYVSVSTVRFFEPGSGSIAPSSNKGPELSHVAAAIAKAKSLGMTVTVNPFVEAENFAFWRGSYDPVPGSDESNTFWEDYEQYLVEVAAVAEANGADFMTIGTELRAISRNSGHVQSLRRVIEAADAVFSGQLGYAANWDNFDHPNVRDTIWEHPAIDFMGVDAYFPLASESEADASGSHPDEIFISVVERSWNDLLEDTILPFARARKSGRGMPVIFTEHGLIPYNRATVQPFSENPGFTQPVDQDEQIGGYHGLITSIDGRGSDLLAVYLWQWGMPGSEDSFWYLHPNGVQNSPGSKFDESLGNAAARFLADFAQTAMQKRLHFAQFGNGRFGNDRFSSEIVVVNPSSTSEVSGEIVFWDAEGRVIEPSVVLPLPAETQFCLQPLGSITFSTTGGGNIISGSVTVTTDGDVSGVIRFVFPEVGIAGVGAGDPAVAVIAPVRRQGGLSTGVAIRNPGVGQTIVNLSLKDEAGEEVEGGAAQLAISGQGRVAKFIHELFPEAETTDFRGTVCVRAQNGKVVVVAVEQGDQPGEFTTLPVSPIRD